MTTRVATALAEGDVERASGHLVQSTRAALGEAPPELLALFCSTAQPLAEAAPRPRLRLHLPEPHGARRRAPRR
jgi:hypothetical protein